MQCPLTPTEESSSASESPKEPLADWLKWLGPENWKQIEASVATLFNFPIVHCLVDPCLRVVWVMVGKVEKKRGRR